MISISEEAKRSPADQADRDAARDDLDRSFGVEAGAGTGKTTLLIERILSLVRTRKAPLDRIVAITFTEKAAGELKVRLRQGLESASSQAEGEEREALLEAVADLERAPISTIHAFCGGLLRERPVEAGLDPAFEPLDEIGLDMLFLDTWEQWLRREMEVQAPALRRALLMGLDFSKLKNLAREIYEHRDLVPHRPFPRPAYSLDDFLGRLDESLGKLKGLISSCRDQSDRGSRSIRSLEEEAREIHRAPLERREMRVCRLSIKAGGNRKNWRPASACDAQKEMIGQVAGELSKLREAVYADAMAGLLEWLRGFLKTMEEEKALRGVVDFQDLLLRTRDLLRDHKGVRRYFQEKIAFLLVDEFQDTDPLQAEVIFYLAESGARADCWEEVEVLPGKLFLVGDPKQSIYRFRRADIEIYEKAKEILGRNGGRLRLFQNFRTVPSIISWVNRIFSSLIVPSPSGPFQPEYIPLAAHPDRGEAQPGQPGVVLLAPPPDFDPENGKVTEVRKAEARSIAALIDEMVGGGKGRFLVADRKGGWRPAGFGDVALLFPTLTGIEAYEEALKSKGIPFRLEGGKVFYLRQEVRDLLACLQALDDPADEIALITALRSPFFGFSDEEIFLFRTSGNRMSYLADPTGPGPLAESLSFLRLLHERRNRAPIAATVSALLSHTKALEFFLLRPGGEQAVANLRKILDQARAFETGRQATFRRFGEWLESRREESVREGESPWSEEGEENVRLITVHKAKGLEFPVVIPANLAAQSSRRELFVPCRQEGTFQASLGQELPFKTLGYAAAWEREQERMAAEERRLLYVAATRARDHLVLPLFWGQRKGYFDLLERALPPREQMAPWSLLDGTLVAGAGGLDLRPAERPPLRESLAEEKEKAQPVILRRRKWQEEMNEVRARGARGPALSTPSAEKEAAPEAAGGGAGGGIPFGLAFHAVMERIDLSGGGDLERLCREKTAEQGAPEQTEEMEVLCRRCLEHPLLKRAGKSKRLFREVPFSVSLETGTMEGKIDLLFEEEEGLVIVDYKTDQIPRGALEERSKVYGEQGSVYARAVEKATGMKVKEVILFFVRLGEAHRIGN